MTNQKFRDEDIRLAVQKQVRKGASEFHKFSGVDEELKIWEKHQKSIKKKAAEEAKAKSK